MARPVATNLTQRQQEILKAVLRLGDGRSCPLPNLVRELGAPKVTSVLPTLQRMERGGWLKVGNEAPGRPRVVEPTTSGLAAIGHVVGTLHAGMSAAGLPGDAPGDSAEAIQCSLHPSGDDYRYVTITGDSMDAAGVVEGDIVLVRRDIAPRPGSIVVAVIEDRCTLKYYHANPDTRAVALVPHSTNPAHKILLLAAEGASPEDYDWLEEKLRREVSDTDVVVMTPDELRVEWIYTGDLIRRKWH